MRIIGRGSGPGSCTFIESIVGPGYVLFAKPNSKICWVVAILRLVDHYDNFGKLCLESYHNGQMIS